MPLLTYNNKNLYFLHIPKTGGSSVYSNLTKQGVTISYLDNTGSQDLNPQHYTFNQCKTIVPNFMEYNKFTILRNPEIRIISEYQWRTKATDYSMFDNWLSDTLEKYNNDAGIYDNHIRPQTDFISKKHTTIFLHEDYKNAMQFINEFFNYSFKFSAHKKRGRIKYKPRLRELTSRETYDKFLEVYRTDLKLYWRKKKNAQV